jgi:hypothetical protein
MLMEIQSDWNLATFNSLSTPSSAISALGSRVYVYISSQFISFLKLLPAFPTSTWTDVVDTFYGQTYDYNLENIEL